MSTSPTLDDVVSKKINPSTSKPFVIKKGQKGDSVGEVQKLLDYLSDDYGNILRRGMDETESGVDSKFGPNTFDAIKKFQEDNGLKIDGIVGSETLTKLKELTK
jgi:peptidoglycan hydrolase-like protein with peptidoglycan-binding domain